MARRRRAAPERERDQREHADDLRRHQQVVGPLPRADADDVDGGQRRCSASAAADADAGRAERHERSIHVRREQDRDRRQRPAVDDEEQRDAVEESDDRMVGALQVDVLAADVRDTATRAPPRRTRRCSATAPPSVHTSRIRTGSPTTRATFDGFAKMPTPTIPPATTTTESKSPSSRRKPGVRVHDGRRRIRRSRRRRHHSACSASSAFHVRDLLRGRPAPASGGICAAGSLGSISSRIAS